MHFALPPRKTSQPPLYARASRKPPRFRQQQSKLLGYVVCGLLTIYLLFPYFSLSEILVDSLPPGTPRVVIVTVFEEQHMSETYIQKIKANREDYAARHGDYGPRQLVELGFADSAYFRLRKLLHKRLQLHPLYGTLSIFVDPDSRSAPCPHKISSYCSFLLAHTACSDHVAISLAPRPYSWACQARIPYAEGYICCPSGLGDSYFQPPKV